MESLNVPFATNCAFSLIVNVDVHLMMSKWEYFFKIVKQLFRTDINNLFSFNFTSIKERFISKFA